MKLQAQPLDENTPVRIGLIVIIIGAVSWMTMIYAKGIDNADQLVSVSSRTRTLEEKQSEMAADIKVIRSILERTETRRK